MALVTQSEFARLAGVKQPSIAEAIKAGKLNVEGKKVDTVGPLTVEYLRRRGSIESGHETPPNNSRIPRSKSPPRTTGRKMVTDELDGYIDDGDEEDPVRVPAPPRGTKAYYDLEYVKQKTFSLGFKNMELVGRVFSREVFDKGFWNPLEAMFVQWNSDLPKTIAATITPLVKSGSEQIEIEAAVRRLLSQSIKACKGKLMRALDSLITLKE